VRNYKAPQEGRTIKEKRTLEDRRAHKSRGGHLPATGGTLKESEESLKRKKISLGGGSRLNQRGKLGRK